MVEILSIAEYLDFIIDQFEQISSSYQADSLQF